MGGLRAVDRRRLTTIVLLLAALGLAVYTSPWVRRFFPSRVVVPAALRALVAPLTPPAPPAPPPVLARADLEAWRQRNGDAWRRDPFFTAAEERAVPAAPAPPVAVTSPPAAPPSYTVKMVLISGAAKVAAIDGRIV
ncbi:MAG: hypothetical protein HY614_03880, partial [Candidatus Rokubacteria bacterium]|nr:hypothetical protein [Candidatus Rokubacteria bacterium]